MRLFIMQSKTKSSSLTEQQQSKRCEKCKQSDVSSLYPVIIAFIFKRHYQVDIPSRAEIAK